MSIPFRARFVDLANLVIAKGSNFIMTVLLFALLARGMDTHAFAEFGYWWSIAIMLGGVVLGGVSSTLVRDAAVHGSLRHLSAPLRQFATALLVGGVALAVALVSLPEWEASLLLLAAVGLFGLAVQAQAALLALLRAAEATRANAFASLLIVLLVPTIVYLMIGPKRGLPWVFFLLACAYAAATLVALAAAYRRLAHLGTAMSGPPPATSRFFASASSFTAVNVFSYAIVNVDFTLFRLLGAPTDFALMGTGKVFFERFVVPVLMVFAGAVSLTVLRQPPESGAGAMRLEARLGPRALAAALATVALLTAAYWLFASRIRGDATTIALPWVACAAAGYLLYAVNGVLFDVLVVQRSLRVVVAHVAAFLLLGAMLQLAAIVSFGVPGWAFAWLAFNLIVISVLAREGLHLRISGGSRGRSDVDVVEAR